MFCLEAKLVLNTEIIKFLASALNFHNIHNRQIMPKLLSRYIRLNDLRDNSSAILKGFFSFLFHSKGIHFVPAASKVFIAKVVIQLLYNIQVCTTKNL